MSPNNPKLRRIGKHIYLCPLTEGIAEHWRNRLGLTLSELIRASLRAYDFNNKLRDRQLEK